MPSSTKILSDAAGSGGVAAAAWEANPRVVVIGGESSLFGESGYFWKAALGLSALIGFIAAAARQPFLALPLFFLLPASYVFMGRRTLLRIDTDSRTLRKTIKRGPFVWSRDYNLAPFEAAEISEGKQVFEGYVIPHFTVRLTGRRRRLTLYSTDVFDEARALQTEIAETLGWPIPRC